MGAYLHQDYSLWYESDDAAIEDFSEDQPSADVKQAVDELTNLLAGPSMGLLARWHKEVSHLDYIIGETDDEARAWLLKARGLMADVLERRDASRNENALKTDLLSPGSPTSWGPICLKTSNLG